MKIIRDDSPAPVKQTLPVRSSPPWKLLVVDDEPDVLQLTDLNLKGFSFDGCGLEILEANSAQEAKRILNDHQDIAVALIDVVMETDDAGLRLVKHIRNELNNFFLRLIIRTGQPGIAPERYVIDHYDIDDYKEKAELTSSHLYTTVRAAIKAYRDLKTLDIHRIGVARVLNAVPDIYQISKSSLSAFFQGVLRQIVKLCAHDETGLEPIINGLIAVNEGGTVTIETTAESRWEPKAHQAAQMICRDALLSGTLPEPPQPGVVIVPLYARKQLLGLIYVEHGVDDPTLDHNLLRLLAQQISSALLNFHLHIDLQTSYNNIVDILAEVAEFKDRSTGGHIRRIDHYTRIVALAMGASDEEAAYYGKASRMHDVGKVGIPDEILRKPGALTPDEYALIQTHTSIGASILGHDKTLDLAREIALHHHERWDGKGYPTATPLSRLSLPVRIVSVVDAFDAMVSQRPYKESWSLEVARLELQKGAGSQFDPEVVAAFVDLLGQGAFEAVMQLYQTIHYESVKPGDI